MEGPWTVQVWGTRGRKQVFSILAGVVASTAAFALLSPRPALLATMLFMSLSLVAYGYHFVPERAQARVEDDALVLAGKEINLRVPRDGIALATVSNEGEFVLADARRNLRVRPDAADLATRRGQSEAIVAALRLAPSQRALRFTDPYPVLRVLALCVTSLVISSITVIIGAILANWYFGDLAPGLFPPLVLAGGLIIGAALWLDTVTLGADGIHVESLIRTHFRPWSAIEDVTVDGGKIVLTPRSAGVFRKTALRERSEHWEGFVTAARTLVAEARAKESAALAERLQRGARDVSQWRAALAADEGAYRATPMDLAALQRVLGNAAAPPDARVGAALALVARASDAGAARVRIAAEATADPLARDALLAAAEGACDESDARIAWALAAIARRQD